MTTQRLADGIYQFTIESDGYVEQLNSVAVVTAEDVVVFDTTTRPSTARRILSEIQKIAHKPVRYVVNSHWHPDHWSGNEVFADAEPSLVVIASEKERNLMLNMAPLFPVRLPASLKDQEKALADEIQSGLSAPGVALTAERRAADELELRQARDMVAEQLKVRRVFPNLTYTDSMEFRHGGREFRFLSVTGDAAGTTVMYLPKERILVTGDVVSYPLPYFTPPLSEHAKSIRELAKLDADIIVPGHGPAFHDKNYMLLEADLFEEVLTQVEVSLRSGNVSIDDVQKSVRLDTFRDRFAKSDPYVRAEFDQFAAAMVRKAYIELRDSKEIPSAH